MSRSLPTLALSILAAVTANSTCLAQAPVAAPPQLRSTEPAGLFEYADVNTAWAASQKSGQPMLLFVTSSHCHFCTRMKNETFSNVQLAPVFPQLFETVAVHADHDQAMVKKLGVRMFPTTLIVSPKGTLLGRLDGFVGPEQMGARINPILNRHYEAVKAVQSKVAGTATARRTIARTASTQLPAARAPIARAPVVQPPRAQ